MAKVRVNKQDLPIAAARRLLALGALAVLRISFELAYDFLVIAGSTRSLMTIQIVWLIALVPALLAGAAWDGVGGVGLATFAVGLVVILPLHLFYLARAGVGLGGLGAGAGSSKYPCCNSTGSIRL